MQKNNIYKMLKSSIFFLKNTSKCFQHKASKVCMRYTRTKALSELGITYNLYKSICTTRKLHLRKVEVEKLKPNENSSSFTYRTHTCGELSKEHVGQDVVLCGWVQYLRLSKFLLLRDGYGITQCVFTDGDVDLSQLTLETVVRVNGVVNMRPKEQNNTNMSTGEIEVMINKIQILNTVENLPFNLRDYQKPKEQLRLHYRYVDLRFPDMQHNLRLRSNMLHYMRRFLVEQHGFVDVETPTLFCQTPGGAREFVVPTHHSGLFYSLVQSPQQFKQMLMAGALDRYFQIARCYRDETTRSDRQPEFTQLDIELSFTTLDDILFLIENLLYETYVVKLPKPPFKRITYREALETYGTDKPNITFDMKLKNITKIIDHKSNDDFGAYCLEYTKDLGKLTAKYKDFIKSLLKKYNTTIVLNEHLTDRFGTDITNTVRDMFSKDSSIIVALGNNDETCLALGEIRDMLSTLLKTKKLMNFTDTIEPLWVVDFPLFSKGTDGQLETCHHPFTAPHPEDLHLLDSNPAKVRSLAYDLVMNGNEVGGGSVRIHDAKLQEKILRMLKIDSGSLGHFLNALSSGCPPHAGIALGIDRLMAIACKTESIRDVIAFPKSHEGKDPLSGAPNVISEEDKSYYHIKSID